MDTCDANESGKISKKEAEDCIMKHYEVPESYRQHVVDAIDQMWPHIDTNGDGEVDLQELKAAIGESSMLAQRGGMGNAAEIMDTCDTDKSGKISQPEAVNCIMDHNDIPEEYRHHVVDTIKQMWPQVDTDGDGEVDLKELEAAVGR
jgi:Ca2+-binding EF-hand superfamily protein